jgi:DNA-binding response OmpR family regulator
MKIIIIDDEKNVRRIIGDYLKNEGYEVVEGLNGMDGIDKIIKHNDFDLILLDIRMPQMDGYETIKEIRQITDTPVIFLTALNETYDEVRGLNLGADDYITKPFSYDILLARVKSCLRKNQKTNKSEFKYKDFTINFNNRNVMIDQEFLNLTQKEYEILELLLAHKNIILDRTKMLDKIWGYDFYGDPRTVDTHIKTLRAKLGDYSNLIKTVRGAGYKFEITQD